MDSNSGCCSSNPGVHDVEGKCNGRMTASDLDLPEITNERCSACTLDGFAYSE